MGVSYVTIHRMATCTMGSMPNYLNVKEDHGVLYGESSLPLMNANDHESGVNVTHFGVCAALQGSKCNPMTFMPWIMAKDALLLEGAPALTDDSKLPCFCGGVISIVKA